MTDHCAAFLYDKPTVDRLPAITVAERAANLRDGIARYQTLLDGATCATEREKLLEAVTVRKANLAKLPFSRTQS